MAAVHLGIVAVLMLDVADNFRRGAASAVVHAESFGNLHMSGEFADNVQKVSHI
jgi:hypothetical protein